MLHPLSFLLILCHFVAFILLLLVSLSLPIIKALYLLEVRATPTLAAQGTSIATLLRFGIWGFCAAGDLNRPTVLSNNGECTPAHLGYIIDPSILELTGHVEIAQAIVKGLTVIFVLHPVAAAVSLIALLFAFPAARSHACGILSLILALVSALVTTIVLVIDYVLVGEMKSRIGPLTNNSFNVSFGNCPWMVLVATVFLWAAVLCASIVVCDCCGCGRQREWHWKEETATHEKSRSEETENQ